MKHHKQTSTEGHAEQILRQAAAKDAMGILAVRLMNQGWAVDMTSEPGTLSANKGNGRLFYPGGIGGRWDITITEMRLTDGFILGDPLTADMTEVIAWQTTVTQSAPADVLIGMAELAATDPPIPAGPTAEDNAVDHLRDLIDKADGEDSTDLRTPRNDDGDDDACTGR